MKRFASLHLACLLALTFFATSALAAGAVAIDDDFATGDHDWQAFFVDHPPGVEAPWGLEAGLRPLPAELNRGGTGFMITGNNHSDDLGMALKKRLGPGDGIVPGQTYWVDFQIEFASNAPSGAPGIGGSPGDSVYLKAGASAVEPRAVLDGGDDHLRPNVNVGFQSLGGPAATVVGVIANGRDAASPVQFVALTREHRHRFPVRADADGQIWLLVMTDSAFEGPTMLHYLRIRTTLTPIDLGDGAGLVNLSSRAKVYPGEGLMIAGFVVRGAESRSYLLRGIGPALAEFEVPDLLADPRLEVVGSAGERLNTNDDWSTVPDVEQLRGAMAAAGAFALPEGSKDAALVMDLSGGTYSALMRGAGDSAGVGLIEVYAVPTGDRTRRLVNLSTRARVGTGSGAIIAGLVIAGSQPERILLRAVGPGLAAHGVADPAIDPILTLYRGQQMIATNVAWQYVNAGEEVASAGVAAGAFALGEGSRDAAMIVTLEPGNYTVVVEDADPAATRTALVEVYSVP